MIILPSRLLSIWMRSQAIEGWGFLLWPACSTALSQRGWQNKNGTFGRDCFRLIASDSTHTYTQRVRDILSHERETTCDPALIQGKYGFLGSWWRHRKACVRLGRGGKVPLECELGVVPKWVALMLKQIHRPTGKLSRAPVGFLCNDMKYCDLPFKRPVNQMFLLSKNKTMCLRNKEINYPWGIAFAYKSPKMVLRNYFLYITWQDVEDCFWCSFSSHVTGPADTRVMSCLVAVVIPAPPPLPRQHEGKNITGKKQYLYQRRNMFPQPPGGDCVDSVARQSVQL